MSSRKLITDSVKTVRKKSSHDHEKAAAIYRGFFYLVFAACSLILLKNPARLTSDGVFCALIDKNLPPLFQVPGRIISFPSLYNGYILAFPPRFFCIISYIFANSTISDKFQKDVTYCIQYKRAAPGTALI